MNLTLICVFFFLYKGFWDGKERKLIQLYDIQSSMDKNKQLVTGQTSNRGFMNNSAVWNSGSNLWISSIEANGDWLAVAGGAEHGHNGITARSSSVPATSGFMTMWHLPTRSFTSGCVTRESVNAIVYNPSMDLFATGANEGRISYWESTSSKCVGRACCSSSATYAMSLSKETGMMVAGGSGGMLDCFVDRVRVSQLRL
jgi:WD40 repeat protein